MLRLPQGPDKYTSSFAFFLSLSSIEASAFMVVRIIRTVALFVMVVNYGEYKSK